MVYLLALVWLIKLEECQSKEHMPNVEIRVRLRPGVVDTNAL